MNTFENKVRTTAREVRFDQSTLHVELQDGSCVSAPLARFPRLLHGSAQQRAVWRPIGAGDGIHWPLLDEDISISGLLKQAQPADVSAHQMEEIVDLVGEIYAKSRRLSQLTGGRRFTLDGVFVSTTGRVVAEYIYGLTKNTEPGNYEGRTANGLTVQVKLVGEDARNVAVRWTGAARASHADLMLCLQVGQSGFAEVYNGEFPVTQLADKPVGSNGQAKLSLELLSEANPALLPKQHSFASINRFFQRKLSNAA